MCAAETSAAVENLDSVFSLMSLMNVLKAPVKPSCESGKGEEVILINSAGHKKSLHSSLAVQLWVMRARRGDTFQCSGCAPIVLEHLHRWAGCLTCGRTICFSSPAGKRGE